MSKSRLNGETKILYVSRLNLVVYDKTPGWACLGLSTDWFVVVLPLLPLVETALRSRVVF